MSGEIKNLKSLMLMISCILLVCTVFPVKLSAETVKQF
jgi:hypothetical protein